jgi:mannose-1-phosphate guanylyltransferase / phosphomannomutase
MHNIETFIIAGGEGKRFKSVSTKPKIFSKLGKSYLIDLILKNLFFYKLKKISLFVGKKKTFFFKYQNKKGIKLIEEKKLLGTSGCFSQIDNNNLKDNILIIFGDILFDINFSNFYQFHLKNNSDITILSHPSDHLFDSDIIETDKKNKVSKIFFKPHSKNIEVKNLTMAGIFIIKKKLLKNIPLGKKHDFSKDFLKGALKNNYRLFSYKTREYCKDLGTPKRFKIVKKDFFLKKHKRYKTINKMKAIFLDRDGVINIDKGPLQYSNPTNFLPCVKDALKILRKLDYLIVMITNQSAIAKGFITIDSLEKSFNKLETSLSKINFYFDGIYYCPHYPVSGYKNENKKYKVFCLCRKPQPGMIFKAAKDLNINLKKSYFIGDTLRDYEAAKAANVKPIILNKLNFKIVDYKYKNDLKAAAKYIKNNDNYKNTV